MKSVSKKSVDSLIRITRKFYATGDEDLLAHRLQTARELSIEAFGSDDKWLQFGDLISAIFGGVQGLCPGCPKADVYRILEILGFAVTDGDQQ